VPPSRAQFLKSHLVVQSGIQRHSVETIAALANATLGLIPSNGADPSEIAAAIKGVNAALSAMDALFAAERDAEGDGEWRGMYWADRHRFTNFQARRREVLALLAVLETAPFKPSTQIDCCQMEYSYQWTPSHLASYPLFYDDADFRARDFVMVSCANATTDGGSCSNLPEGGLFKVSATVTLVLPTVSGDPDGSSTTQIWYTLDGSDPASSSSSISSISSKASASASASASTSASTSTIYTKPITLKETTTIRAVKVIGGPGGALADGATVAAATATAVVQQRNVTFTKQGN